jgi:hypothetical protein
VDYTTRQMLKDIAENNVVDINEEVRFDYGVRVDGNPEYVGRAPQGTLSSDDTWIIKKMEYDLTAAARLVRMQALIGAWDDRATLNWS